MKKQRLYFYFTGHVLLHPKLKDPANTTPDQTGETIFPAINTLEPNLSKDQIHKLMNDVDEFDSFTTKVKMSQF